MNNTADPIRYADGALIMSEDDLNLGTGGPIFERSYSNRIGHTASELGASWATERQPRIVIDAGNYLVRTDAHSQVAFTPGAGNTWVPIRSARETLTSNAVGDLVFADPTGEVIVFNSFNAAIPVRQQGRVKRMYTSGGLPITSTYDANGFVQSQTRSTTTVGLAEVLAFTYDPTSGLLTAVERRQQPAGGGAQVLICRAEYGFDTTTSQLRSVVVKDPAGAVLRRFHYRYYTVAETGSSIGMLRNAVGPRTYARMQQAGIDPETATDAVISAWADKSFQYDTARRVTQQVLRTPDVDGSGTYNYTYTPRTSPPATPGPNDWLMRFGETQPDGSVNTVFTNQAGDVLFKQTATSAGVVVSAEAWRFDAGWRATWHITPAAMQASGGVWFDAAQTDVLGFGGGNSPYVNDTVGLIERWTYFATTGSGGAAGYLQHEQTQQGELGTPTLLKSYTYVASP